MNKVGIFEKVSYPNFCSAVRDALGVGCDEASLRQMYDALTLPHRATGGSAGYDFRSPFSFTLSPGGTAKIPTGIRVKIDGGWWLGCLPRSGLGFKYRLQLDNTVGVIDSDYYYSDNEGHIFIKVTNDSTENKILHISAGDSFAQGIFLPYGISYDDNATAVRNGGFGSTDAKA